MWNIPLTTLHVPGEENAMTDIPSCSFGSEPKWFCKTDADLLKLYSSKFPFPDQNFWTVYQPTSVITTRVLSVLRMKDTGLEEWKRLPRRGKHIGKNGDPLSNLWEWTLGFRTPRTSTKSGASLHSQECQEKASMVEEERSKLAQSLGRSRPLAR